LDTGDEEQFIAKNTLAGEIQLAERLAKAGVRHIVEGYANCKVTLVTREGQQSAAQQSDALMMQFFPKEEMANGLYEDAKKNAESMNDMSIHMRFS
jgi:hypothetical protein